MRGTAFRARGRTGRRAWKSVGVALALALALAACRPAVIEGTDQGFGSNGMVSTLVSSHYSGEQVADLAVQPDGKIVAVGFLACYECNAVAAIARYNANGTLDTSFGSGGKHTFNWLGCCDAYATSVAIQPDGKILVGGGVHYCCVLTNDSLGVARFNPDGSLDQTFGTNGKVTTDLAGPVTSYISDIALQPDGKIVAVASTGARSNPGRITVVRYLANGHLDPSFGAAGIAQPTPPPKSNECDSASSVAIDAEGRIVVGGTGAICDGSSSDAWFDVVRLQANGQPDPAFGANGLVQTTSPPTSNNSGSSTGSLAALAVQPDGRVVAVGSTLGGGGALVRYNPDGTLDTSFGGTGIVNGDSRMGSPQAVAIRADGTIITANATGSDDGFIVVQWHPDGTHETPTVDQVGASSAARAIAIQPDGKIVAGGYSYPETTPTFVEDQFALVRYPADRTTPTIIAPQGRQVPKPVEAYAPHVFLATDEKFTPSDATQYVRDSSLWWDYGTWLFAPPEGPAEVMECGPGQEQAAKGAFSIIGLANGAYAHRRRIDVSSCDQDASNSTSSDDASVDPSGNPNGDGFYLNYEGADGGIGTAAPVYYDFQDRHFITYWFFYPYNAGGVPATGDELNSPEIDNHHGDWENITVRLNCNDEPIGVDYAAHGDDHIDDWPGQEATPNDPSSSTEVLQLLGGTHPATFSALGTHASYATPGPHPLFGGLGNDSTGDGGAEWLTESHLQPLSAQPWYGYAGSWGQKMPNTDDPRPDAPQFTWGPNAPHYPDKTGAPADWSGPCVPAAQ